MAVTPTAAFVQTPKLWTASVNNGDASAWKILRDAATAAGAGANGSKITGIYITTTDSSARDYQLAVARQYSCTVSNGASAVVTITTGCNIANGDQVIFEAATIPTGVTAGTTYFAVSASPSTQASTTGTFQFSTSFGGSSVTTSSTGTTVVVYVLRIVATVSAAITAGTVSGTANGSFFSPAYWIYPPQDNDGNPYLFLESSDFLAVSCTGTVTSAKITNVTAIGGNF